MRSSNHSPGRWMNITFLARGVPKGIFANGCVQAQLPHLTGLGSSPGSQLVTRFRALGLRDIMILLAVTASSGE
jgi:hypothetical protein